MGRRLFVVCLFCLGCHVGDLAQHPAHDNKAPATFETRDGAGASDETTPAPIANAPRQATSDLSTATHFLDQGDDRGACLHLDRFVQQHPEHATARFCLAELLWKQGQRVDARRHFEQVAALAQESPKQDLDHCLHVNARLLDAAEADEDDYAMRLQRGIGLWLLASIRGRLPDPQGDLPVEGLLCRAASELAVAHTLRPDEARPCWYLFMVWRQLAQPQQAGKWLNCAREVAPFSSLTPAEQRDLHLAATLADGGRFRR